MVIINRYLLWFCLYMELFIYLFIFLEMSYLIYYLKKIRYVILIKFLNIEYNLSLIVCVCVCARARVCVKL